MEKIILKKRWRFRSEKGMIKILAWTDTRYMEIHISSQEKIRTQRLTKLINNYRKNNLN